ncbi:hypothetical protein PFICI_15286 [Pestalotiopsis fici W106-1]|uniref:SCP domain-containing protein n=1 Tax=Pestalotiopsis fici (strain W106-1 / CGMCC3.15140) TaxID=1229662 RepID=W3WJX9_PESFW|nr:uncharacterized protein PFICI_15286 [Pestalotiopsis fici W106-1]ETS73111.1 hypothetical protein PFICI_15286 [Pestalotiopsis fici W106-1]
MAQLSLGAVRLILLLLPFLLIHSSHGAVLNKPAIVERQFRGGDFQRGGGNQGGNQRGGNQGGGNSRGGNNQIWLTYDQWNALNIQNSYRRGRNLRPLVWDRILQQDAQNWANHLAYIDQMVHSTRRGSEGENLAWISGGSNPLSASANMWMAESENYWGQIIPNGDFESYGHYKYVVEYQQNWHG